MEQKITIRPVKKFGTRELSDNSFNTMSGCSNDCRYCYAAHAALEKGYLKSRAEWKRERAFPAISASFVVIIPPSPVVMILFA